VAAAENKRDPVLAGSLDIEISRQADLVALESEWRALELRVPGLSFFQSWTWMGCLVEEQFTDPVVVRVRQGGETVGLALFNRRAGGLHLGESGDPVRNIPFIEHNSPLVTLPGAAGRTVLAAILKAAWQAGRVRRMVLSGVSEMTLAAAEGRLLKEQRREAPLVDLATIRAAGGDYVSSRSANTRYQLRRSLRRYATRGELLLAHANEAGEALAWLDALIVLHTQTWRRRGKSGAFGQPFVRRFHEALLLRALERGELELLQLTAGSHVVGYLYNFRLGGRVSAYQSGLCYPDSDSHEKPGLSLHALAIERALAAGDMVYDFLAGADRYKRSLASSSIEMVWAELARPHSLFGLGAAVWQAMRRLAER
jgi:CelD/BcsL family acetyltransferase involved in cellulose biosynthesis